MNEQYPRRPDGPWSEDRRGWSATPDHLNPTEQFPPAQFPSAQFPPAGPLAHEGGFPYGLPPAAPYGYADAYLPQHLHVAPQPFPQGHYPPQFGYPPPMQPTVYVHGGQAKRVNHALHLILTILTAGLWLPIWIILAIANS